MMISRAVILICFLLIELVISIIIFEDIFNSNKPWVRTLGWIMAAIIIVAVIGCGCIGIYLAMYVKEEHNNFLLFFFIPNKGTNGSM